MTYWTVSHGFNKNGGFVSNKMDVLTMKRHYENNRFTYTEWLGYLDKLEDEDSYEDYNL